jgi:hypothetical protein
MDRARRCVTIMAAIVLLVVFVIDAQSGDDKAKAKSYEYKGTVKTLSRAKHAITIQTASGTRDFHYQRHGKMECAGFRELAVGDTIKVISQEDKAFAEATCITKEKAALAAK